MDSQDNGTEAGDAFEAGLRDILSNGAANASAGPERQSVHAPPAYESAASKWQAARRAEEELNAPFWLKLLRPAALLALLGLLLLFSYRFTTWGG